MKSMRASSNILQRALAHPNTKLQNKGRVLKLTSLSTQRRASSLHILSSINVNNSINDVNTTTSNSLSNSLSTPLSNSRRSFSSLPYHLVVGMPALSPTMETGTISEWKVAEGESFIAGDSLAEIETDKASIDFEAQDDGVVAKILVPAGAGEIAVGVPILVTVEEEDDVAAFQDFVPDVVVEEKEKVAEPEAVEAPAPAPVVEAPPVAAAAAPEPVVAAAPAVPEPPAPAVAPAPESTAEVAATMVSPGWGNFARVKSPLAGALSASQKKYVELYGSTGQVPL